MIVGYVYDYFSSPRAVLTRGVMIDCSHEITQNRRRQALKPYHRMRLFCVIYLPIGVREACRCMRAQVCESMHHLCLFSSFPLLGGGLEVESRGITVEHIPQLVRGNQTLAVLFPYGPEYEVSGIHQIQIFGGVEG
jgi:hypothetical protein